MNKQDRIDLDRVVFIGRTYDEYMRMFDLNETMLRKGAVLDCAAGPSSFTAEAHAFGIRSVACDILYKMPSDALVEKGRQDVEEVYRKVDHAPDLFVWKYYKDRNYACSLRHKALDHFSRDFMPGLKEGRYVHAELPRLPFADKTFSLVLSSHLLFLYGDRLNTAFHVASLLEMARVSYNEVRVYPLQGLDAKPSLHLDGVLTQLRTEGMRADIIPTPFEFQRGANKMLRMFR